MANRAGFPNMVVFNRGENRREYDLRPSPVSPNADESAFPKNGDFEADKILDDALPVQLHDGAGIGWRQNARNRS